MRVFQNYHRHSMYTNIKIADSTAKNEDYAKRAQELGHGIISSVEHGFQGRYIEGYELAKQYGLKFLFGTEAYWVKDRFEKDRTNAHIVLLAKNENGRQAINDILAEANITGYYYQPRLDLSLILSLPKDDVWVTTACVAFWRYDDEQIVVDLHNHFDRNFFLEVQYHDTEAQKELNKKILNLANRHNIQIIMGCDSHYISEEKSWERDEYIKSSGIVYEDEQGWYLDYPDGDTAYQRFVEQGVLTKAQIEDAIANTNTFLQVEEYNNPCFTKDIKMPSLYPHLSQEEKDKLFCELIWWKWEQEKEKVPIEKHEHYVSEIQKELDTIIVTKHADYFLLDYELVRKAKEKGGVITPSGRGCFTKDALVHTKTTMKNISDIEIGDLVICADGKFHPVIDVHKYDIEETMIKIKHLLGTDTYFPTICTEDHKILINRKNSVSYIQASNIQKGDFVCVPKITFEDNSLEIIDLNAFNSFGFSYDEEYIYEEYETTGKPYPYSPSDVARNVGLSKTTVEKFANGLKAIGTKWENSVKKIMAYIPFSTQEQYCQYIKSIKTRKIKRYLKNDELTNTIVAMLYGDGVANSKKMTVSIALNTQSNKNIENRKLFFDFAERLNVSIYENKSKTRNLTQLTINSKILSNFISQMFFESEKGKDKIFNPVLFQQNQKNLSALLNGFFIADGSNSEEYGRKSFDNTSLSLINAFKLLRLATGKPPCALSYRKGRIDDRGFNNKESYKLRFNDRKDIKERFAVREDENYFYLPIINIEKLEKRKETVYDLTIAEQHNFLINNMIVHNSGVSNYVNKLLGFTKIDRISASVKMYPERFMSATRILESKSLADLDLNLANPEVFFEAQKELLGEQSAYQMLAYGTMKTKSAWKMYARAKGIDAETANVVSEQIKKYETKLKHAEEDEKDDIDLMDFIEEQYHEYMNDSLQYRGIIAQISPHTCASLLYSGNIRKEIGLILVKSTSGKKETLCTIMDGKWAEDYKFLKNDLLKVNVVDVIDKVFKKIGMEIPNENELIQMCDGVQSVWDVYGHGFTLGINQVEQNSTRHRVMKYKPKNISELSAFVAAVRPGFKSMYSIFEARERFDYGIPVFDDLIQTKEMPNSFLLYQEMSMAALNFAGIQMSECYEVVKNISKKRVEKVTKYKEQFLEGFSKKIVEVEHRTNQEAHDIADKVWQIIEDSTRYQFNASHSYSVAMDSLYGAWLKSQHPLAFYEVFLTVLDEKGSKDRMKAVRAEAENAYKIRFAPLRFRQDNRKITSDEATNSIWGTLKSIKGFGTAIADQMYSMKDMKFDSFVDFLVYIEENGIMCSKIEDLIKVQYFSEFGGGQKLLTIYKEFSDGKNRYDKKYKTETKAKRLIALYEFELSLADENFPLIQQMEMEQEILGYTQVIMPIDKKFVFVQDINTTYAPRVEVYCLANAKTESMKIDRRTFGSKPIELHDILLLKKWKSKPQIKYVNGKYEPACGNPFHKSSCKGCAEADGCGMKEWWIEDYDIRNDIKTNT